MLLEKINSPDDLRKLDVSELPQLAQELRDFIINTVSKTGGHLASSLGVVELTIALHYVLNSPKDKIIWDVGHQAYPHKILTGRRDKFYTLRQYKGISGFPRREESVHDAFNTGHSSTSISAALGLAKARDLKKEKFNVVAVIGDGALTGGMAFEAINQLGYLGTKLIIILNDNRMSISMNVGALSEYTHRIEKTKTYQDVKKDINLLLEKAADLKPELEHLKEHLKMVGTPGLVFEKLGINYIGPVDGHDIPSLIDSINKAVQANGPVMVHVKTTKGKGYAHAEKNATEFHGVSSFNIGNGEKLKKNTCKTYTDVFSSTLIRLAKTNPNIIAITAAMPDGTGLSNFSKHFPERFFDVGIAEQHAVTFASGLAIQGFKPVVAIYSTFLQRAYDQLVHDVCLQNLPVVFAIDRAGLVGEDGPTHHGAFDISYLRHIPNLVIMAPKDENELQHMLKTAVDHNGPIALRYPRGYGVGTALDEEPKGLTIGESEIVKKDGNVLLVTLGSVFYNALESASELKKEGIDIALVNARFVKPIDSRIIDLAGKIKKVVIVEENVGSGGFGSAFLEEINDKGLSANISRIALPDSFIEHASQAQLREMCGLTKDNILNKVREIIRE
jgi:1-deoxy-D-xylulose-5-phosphate synthase